MNNAIIQHLSQGFIEGKRMLDSPYNKIVNTTANKLKLISKDKDKIKTLIAEHTTNITKCTLGFISLNKRVDQHTAQIEQILEKLKKNG